MKKGFWIFLLFIGSSLPGCRTLSEDERAAAQGQDSYGYPVGWDVLREYREKAFSPDLGENSNLEDYLQYGLEHHPGLRAAFERWSASLDSVPQATALPEPSLNYQRMLKDGDNLLGVSQSFPWFGKRGLRGEIASKESESLWWNAVTVRLSVLQEIKKAYLEYAYLAQAERIQKESLGLLREMESVAKARFESGSSQEDWLRLQVETGKMENELRSLQRLRPALSTRLSSAMNRKDSSLLPWPGPLELKEVLLPREKLAQLAAENNPNLQAILRRLEEEEKRTELAALEKWPDFSLGAEYQDRETFGTLGSDKNKTSLQLSINLPLWREKYAAMERQSRKSQSAAKLDLAEEQNKLLADLEMSVFEMDDAWRQSLLYRDRLIPNARQSLDLVRAGFQAGKSGLLELLDSQKNLLAFEQAYWRAVSNYEIALAELESCCGVPLR